MLFMLRDINGDYPVGVLCKMCSIGLLVQHENGAHDADMRMGQRLLPTYNNLCIYLERITPEIRTQCVTSGHKCYTMPRGAGAIRTGRYADIPVRKLSGMARYM